MQQMEDAVPVLEQRDSSRIKTRRTRHPQPQSEEAHRCSDSPPLSTRPQPNPQTLPDLQAYRPN